MPGAHSRRRFVGLAGCGDDGDGADGEEGLGDAPAAAGGEEATPREETTEEGGIAGTETETETETESA